MMGVILFLATATLAAAGFALLAFSQRQHWPLLMRARPAPPAIAMRSGGAGVLALAVLPAIWRDGIAFGLLLWALTLTLGAALIVLAIWHMAAKRNDRVK